MVKLSIDLPSRFLDDEPKTLVVSKRRKKIWAVALDLLVQLDQVCRKHSIRYFCDGGTALGAIRHHGFIPWDDDIDVIMSRAEYDKLNAVAPAEFKYPYFWQTNATDPGSARGHAQLRNSATTGILKSEMRDGKPIFNFNQGLFIDVFPFDNLPDDEIERRRFRARLRKIKARISQIKGRRLALKSFWNDPVTFKSIYHFYHGQQMRIWEFFRGYDTLSEAISELETAARHYNGSQTREVAPVSFAPDHREVLPANFLDEAVEVDFEFIKIPVMAHYLESLEINYGTNWREHVIGASAHGGMFIDTDRPYTDYLTK